MKFNFKKTLIIFVLLLILLFIASKITFYIHSTKYNKEMSDNVKVIKKEKNILEASYVPPIFNKYNSEEYISGGSAVNIFRTRFFCEKPIINDLRNKFNLGFEDKSYMEIIQVFDRTDNGDMYTNISSYDFMFFKEYTPYAFTKKDNIDVNLFLGNKNQKALYSTVVSNTNMNDIVANRVFWKINQRDAVLIVSYENCVQSKEELIKITNGLK